MDDPRLETVLETLGSLGSEDNRAGMARFGINTQKAFGVSIAQLRPLARRLGRDHNLALALWQSGWHEARILAGFIADPKLLTRAEQDRWVAGFDSWDLCDQVCDLLLKTPWLDDAIATYAADERTFVRRAGFVLIARRAVKEKTAPDALFLSYLPLIEAHATDKRNFVKKAVNWALRQIGKRNAALHASALVLAEKLRKSPDKTARWIAADAIKDLNTETTLARFAARR